MPYVILLIVIVVAAGAILLFQSPEETPIMNTEEPARVEEADTTTGPAGFTPPTTPPPTMDAAEPDTDTQSETDNQADQTPQAVMETDESGASGTYVGEASYSTGRAIHELDVTLTLENDIVVAADVEYDGGAAPTPILRSFNDAYQTEVVGKDIDSIELSRVGGASWTSEAFNEAVAEVRAQL